MAGYRESQPEFFDRLYQLAAEHGCRPVMDELYDYARGQLRHPDLELRRVASIARGRSKEPLHAQS
jgi:hypothetical protein